MNIQTNTTRPMPNKAYGEGPLRTVISTAINTPSRRTMQNVRGIATRLLRMMSPVMNRPFTQITAATVVESHREYVDMLVAFNQVKQFLLKPEDKANAGLYVCYSLQGPGNNSMAWFVEVVGKPFNKQQNWLRVPHYHTTTELGGRISCADMHGHNFAWKHNSKTLAFVKRLLSCSRVTQVRVLHGKHARLLTTQQLHDKWQAAFDAAVN